MLSGIFDESRPRISEAPSMSTSSSLVVARAAILTFDSRIEGLLLARCRVRAGARPPVVDLLYLSLGRLLHDLLPQRIALLALDVLQLLALQVRMCGEDAVRGVGAEHIEVSLLEAALPLVEHL